MGSEEEIIHVTDEYNNNYCNTFKVQRSLKLLSTQVNLEYSSIVKCVLNLKV